mmetsp:Transcript_28162/g.57686  ORF Transcript_28162/g.57686 Transcript_28162/m.57686 type:complete len:215 (-) Transcript_28162:453-1097(-)
MLGCQRSHPVVVCVSCAHCRPAQQLLGRLVHRAVRVVTVLEEIGTGNESNQFVLVVDDWQLAFLAALHQLVGLGQCASLLGDNQLARHDFRDREIVIPNEIDVPCANHSKQFAPDLAVLCDWDATKAFFGLDVADVLDRGIDAHRQRVIDEPVLETFHRSDHVGLLFDRTVVVNDAHPALQSHGHSEIGFTDGVHGRRHKGALKPNVASHSGAR